VENFLIPLLSRQGLVDIGSLHLPLKSDHNVALWLAGQQWTFNDLYSTGETLLLWTKMSAHDVEITRDDIVQYMTTHPGSFSTGQRVQLDLITFEPPSGLQGFSRSVTLTENSVMSPFAHQLLSRGNNLTPSSLKSKQWDRLQLYLDLDAIDSALKDQLTGKKIGDSFGPLTLLNGTVVAGKVAAILPPVNLAQSRVFAEYATLLTRLHKSKSEATYQELVSHYNLSLSSRERDLFGDILGAVGTAIGAGMGGLGAPILGTLGTMAGNWIDGQISQPSASRIPIPTTPPPSLSSLGGYHSAPQYPPVFTSYPPQQPLPMISPYPVAPYGSWPVMRPRLPWTPPIFLPFPVRI
jgi:hypothetical protein